MRRKLTAVQAMDIFNDPRSRHVIASEYGVTIDAVAKIQNKQRWVHIHDDGSRPSPRYSQSDTVHIYAPKGGLIEQVRAMAVDEGRSVSSMILRLCAEAIELRRDA